MENAKYEEPQAKVVEFGEGDMGRAVTTSGDIYGDGTESSAAIRRRH